MKGNREKDERKLPSECTTIIVGEKQSADGARYLCRSSDFDALMAVNVEVHHDTDNGPEEFVAKDSKFRCPLPRKALGYKITLYLSIVFFVQIIINLTNIFRC